MNPTLDLGEHAPECRAAMVALDRAVRSGLEAPLVELVYTRVSQINGCAFCVDLHSHDALAGGEDLQRVLSLPAWRESPFYTTRERAALALAESGTRLADMDTPMTQGLWDECRAQFDEAELAALIAGIAAINAWNRIAILGNKRPSPRTP